MMFVDTNNQSAASVRASYAFDMADNKHHSHTSATELRRHSGGRHHHQRAEKVAEENANLPLFQSSAVLVTIFLLIVILPVALPPMPTPPIEFMLVPVILMILLLGVAFTPKSMASSVLIG